MRNGLSVLALMPAPPLYFTACERHPVTSVNQGNAKRAAGNLPGAIVADFDKAISLDPSNAVAFNDRGLT